MAILLLANINIGCAHAWGNKKKHNKNNKARVGDIKVIEAYSQKTMPGRREPPVTSNNNFVLIWQNKQYPETFFWRGEGGWQTCKIMKAHKIPMQDMRNVPRGMDYRSEFVAGDGVHEGDTLMLTPLIGGKFPIPAEIPDTAKNDLFYKCGGSGWLKFHIDTIVKKHDIIAP